MATPHPLLVPQGFTFKSPPLVEFVEEFSRLVQNGEVSMVCYGAPRFGKSTARRFLQEKLDANGQMVVVSAILDRDVKNRDSRNSLWRDLLRGKDRSANLMSASPYDTLFNKLCVEADMRETSRVLVILDEAQNLTLEKLAGLKKFIDELIEHGLAPFVLLMAQPEILIRPARLKVFHFEDLIDRFFTRMYRFRGLSPDEIVGVLSLFDKTEWPESSGTSFTAHFLETPWKQGWRLENQAITFKAKFAALNKRLNTGTNEIGMKYLVTAVRILFNTMKGASYQPFELDALIEASVSQSGLAQAYQIVGNAEGAVTSGFEGKRTRARAADA